MRSGGTNLSRRGRLMARDVAGRATVETREVLDTSDQTTGAVLRFETRVSGGLIAGGFQRYASEHEALEGHRQWVRLVAGAERIESGDPVS